MRRSRYLFPAALLLLCTAVLYLLLPAIANQYLLPQLIARLPFAVKELQVSHVSLFSLRGSLRLAEAEQQSVSLPSLELRYHPADLLRGRVDSLLINAATLHTRLVDGRPTLIGLSGSPANPSEQPLSLLLPLAISTITLNESSVIVHRDLLPPLLFRLDGSVTLDTAEMPEKGFSLSGLSGELRVGGQADLTVALSMTPSGPGHRLEVRLQVPDLAATLLPWQRATAPLAAGDLQLEGWAEVQDWQRLGAFSVRLDIADFTSNLGGLHWQNRAGRPLHLELTGSGDRADWQITDLALTSPSPADLVFRGTLNRADAAFTGTGEITPEGIAVPATVSFTVTLSDTGTALRFTLAHDGFAHGDTLRFSGISAEGDLVRTAAGIDGQLDLQLKAIDTAVAGLTGLSVHLPVRYPLPVPGDAPVGHYSIAEIRYQGDHVGTLTGEIQPSREGAALKALLTSPIQPEMALSCQGPVSLQGEVTLHCRLPETPLRSADLASFFQLPAELSLDGALAADARLTLRRGIPAADLRISLAVEELAYRHNRVSGVNCALTLPRLPLLESAPSQLCTIGAADLGNFRFTNGRVRYRLEDPLALFIETARMNWCQGTVETGGLRLTPGTTDADLTLYCDRLNFAELLEQFGITGTEGEGSLNGRLPLLISDRRLQLADGFLFSTPGNGGIVRFNNTEQLREGMPDIGESTSLAYTMQALENFWYNWAKLSFNSHGDELLVALQLDGKPTAPLAFRLKNGEIVPDDKGAGLQHPIRLDVNFRLPLQEMFDYGRGIHSLLENR